MSAVPGAEARAGRFPGPSLMPRPSRDSGGARLASARGARHACARAAPAPLRDRRPDLVLPPLPDRASAQGRAGLLPRPVVLAAGRRGARRRAARALSRRPGRAPARGLVHRPLRRRAGGGGERVPGGRGAGIRAGRSSALERVHAGRSRGRPGRRAARANDPYEPDARDYRVLRAALAGSIWMRPGSWTSSRSRACAGWAGPAFPRAPSGSSWQSRRRSPSTRSATPTSPSPAPSRTARSWPSSRISCWRACCSACS